MIIVGAMKQGSDEWLAARLGRPSASQFKRIITPAKGDLSKSADEYAAELVAERLGHRVEHIITDAMQNGIDTEAEARAWAELELDSDILQVGMILTDDERASCSPDGLLYHDNDLVAGIEIKCPLAKTHILWRETGTLPDAHKAQVHGSLWLTGLPSWFFMSYVPGLEPLLLHVEPDDYTQRVGGAITTFIDQVDTMAARYL